MTEPATTARTVRAVRDLVRAARERGAKVALVPTMGALHAGHLALVDRARQIADFVVVSIFVNPLQFGPGEDLERYPRDLAADLERLGGRATVFAPSVEELYPADGIQTRIVAGPVASLYEGSVRPGHFDGVLTVVGKLLNIVQPDTVVFGQKDAQQVFLVRRMVDDLNVPVAIETVPIVREHGGLALSSRNRYLDADQAVAARRLSCALEAAAEAAESGLGASVAAAHAVLDGEPMIELGYLEFVDPSTFLPVPEGYTGQALAILAARVGATRLIDNATVNFSH